MESNNKIASQERLDCFLKTLRHASWLPSICCELPTDKQGLNHNDFPKLYVDTIVTKARSLFVDICRRGQQLHKNSKDKDASIIVLKLVIALHEYPELCDDTIIGALAMMAEFFKDMGNTQQYEWVLEKASIIYNASKHPYIEDPCKALVSCLSKSSRSADEFLPELFKNNLMDDGARKVVVPAIPVAQLAAQCSSADILKLVAASSDSMEHPTPGLFNLEALHLTAAAGREDTLKDLLRKCAPVDDKDLHNHTALFMAALNGHKDCCEALLEWGANPDEKDAHGTSILEVAVKGGHLEVVKLLVEAEADLNPTRPCPCTPSLLAAAIKSSMSALAIVTYLLKKGAIVDKTAIDLATESGLDVLAQRMLQLQQTQQQNLAFFEPDLSSGKYRH